MSDGTRLPLGLVRDTPSSLAAVWPCLECDGTGGGADHIEACPACGGTGETPE